MTIEERDLPLLISLQENPLAPASKLAQAVNLSVPTVINRLELLREDKVYYKVSADLLLDTLELEIVDILIEIESLDKLTYFEQKICYKHPYTLFRIRCFGNFFGLYTQFRIPIKSKEWLVEFLEYLKKNKTIQDFTIINVLKDSKPIYTTTNLANWEPNLMRWNFNWENWFSKLDTNNATRLKSKKENSLLNKIDNLDIALLQELTISARRKNTEIMESLKLDKNIVGLPQKISRKLQFLTKKAIAQFRVSLQWETFEIFNSFLMSCDCEKKTSYKLQNHLSNNPIPFESTFKLTEKGFLWYVRCPASHFSNISEIIWRLCKKVDFFYLDYKSAIYYGLWKGAFDHSNHNWSIDLMKKEKVLEE